MNFGSNISRERSFGLLKLYDQDSFDKNIIEIVSTRRSYALTWFQVSLLIWTYRMLFVSSTEYL